MLLRNAHVIVSNIYVFFGATLLSFQQFVFALSTLLMKFMFLQCNISLV